MAKKYWLKLNAHFFKDSHLIYLKTQKNGYEYIYLWQCLLLKCLEVEDDKEIGFLRLNEKIPYTPELLSEVFAMNIDIVKCAVDIFYNIGMLEILDDGTIYIEAVQKMIGKESESAERVRLHRERKNNKLLQCNNVVTECNPIYNKNKNKEKELEKEKDNIDQFFCDWWELYNKKVGKQEAKKEFIKLHPDYELFNIIMNHTKKYCEAKEKEFRKDPERYIKKQSWNDEIITKTKKQKQNAKDYEEAFVKLQKLGASKNGRQA